MLEVSQEVLNLGHVSVSYKTTALCEFFWPPTGTARLWQNVLTESVKQGLHHSWQFTPVWWDLAILANV